MGIEKFFIMQPNITVTELLKKLKKENNIMTNNNFSDEDSDLEIDETHTEIQQSEQDDLEPIYQELEELRSQINLLVKRIEKLEIEKKPKIFKEKVEFKEVNPLYNAMFNIPENERTYKPTIVKEEIKDSKNKSIMRGLSKSKTRKRSQSKRRKYK